MAQAGAEGSTDGWSDATVLLTADPAPQTEPAQQPLVQQGEYQQRDASVDATALSLTVYRKDHPTLLQLRISCA